MITKVEDVYSHSFREQRKIDIFVPEVRNGACLLFIHGGGFSAGNKEQWHEVARYFCEMGYVCASAGYRLAPDHVFPSQIEDVRLAMQFMKQASVRFGYRPDAITAIGSSAGGYLAAVLGTIPEGDSLGETAELTCKDTTPQAVVCYCPVSTLLVHRPFVKVYMGTTVEEQPELYRTASPLHRVHGQMPPFLFIQGNQDPTTTLQDTSRMCHQINESGGIAELVVLPGVKHGFGYGTTTTAQKQSIQQMELFLKRHGR